MSYNDLKKLYNEHFYFKFIKKIDDNKVQVYIYFFILYFLIYYSITIPSTINDLTFNPTSGNNNNIAILCFIIFINILYVFLSVYVVRKYQNTNKSIAILVPIALSGFVLFWDVLFMSKYLEIFNKFKIIKYIFLILSYLFFIVFFILFLDNINNEINIEFLVSVLIIVIFIIFNLVKSSINMNKIYYLLKNNDYSMLSINCFNNSNTEHYAENNSQMNMTQINNINNKYGDNYLKTIGNIPISFYNKFIKDYQDLVLADFYYPCSYYSYLADTPLNGTPNLDALKNALSVFKVRFVHLDIFSDKTDPYDPLSNPIVRCKDMKYDAKPLNFEETLGVINKWAWTNDNLSYPFFLYLNFNFNIENSSICVKIYNSLIKFFSKYLIDKKYSFSGRNNLFSISMAKIKECLGKIIIITNEYPTKTALDELINISTNKLDNNLNLKEYKDSYIEFNKVGLSQDNNKTMLLNNSKTNMFFYYTVPNKKYKNNNQPKAGLYNPSFQDCAQYGIQGTLMYLFAPDDNLNKWYSFFKNKNNFDPVLKDELLRSIITVKNDHNQQNPVVGLQKPQEYCLIPGLMNTEKSNLSGGFVNGSCQNI